MKEKIDWYREVLELEPGSKVFFPLAQLLAEYGQLQDALSTLRLGLERHPEFMEARLYLIDLLYKNGEIVSCEQQVSQLTRLFSRYPGFWEAWGAYIAGTGEKRDLALALRFLGALFQRPDLDMAQVLETGLHALVGTPEHLPPSAASTDESAVHGSSPAARRPEEMDDMEEPFTLRTKSMADVLAGQSDIGGALDIYRELAMRTESPEERQEIHERIAQLSSLPEQAVGAPPPSPRSVFPPPGKQRMQHLLESLAERLEARARG